MAELLGSMRTRAVHAGDGREKDVENQSETVSGGQLRERASARASAGARGAHLPHRQDASGPRLSHERSRRGPR